jgi:acetylornithine/N-succinyldiaminopimelate aminotransferase
MPLAPNTHTLGVLSQELIAKGRTFYVPNYKPRDMILDHGKGSVVWDMDGNDYVDLGSGIAVCSLGHQDPDLLAALDMQSRKLWHTSNIFFTEPPIHLAEKLVKESCFAQKVFFCNSGAEANEAAIKLARKYAADKGKTPAQRNIISFKGSFHGRTMATVTLTAQPKYHVGFEPMPGGFIYCDKFNDEDAISAMVDENTCAIFVEPVQGEGGVMPAKPGFLKHLRALCDKVGALLVIDEIQAGMGRTGSLFAHCQDSVIPDVVTLAKALGGGIPIGAMLVGGRAADVLQFGTHGTTFGGNPLMAAVALASVTKLARQDILANVADKGEKLRAALKAINDEMGLFKEIRGRGLMIGAELTAEHAGKSGDISELARKHGVLVLVAGPDVMRFLPPLTITDDELNKGIERFTLALADYKAGVK